MSEEPRLPPPVHLPEWAWLSMTPFARFAYHLGFSQSTDLRFHADWWRFQPETKPTRGRP